VLLYESIFFNCHDIDEKLNPDYNIYLPINESYNPISYLGQHDINFDTDVNSN